MPKLIVALALSGLALACATSRAPAPAVAPTPSPEPEPRAAELEPEPQAESSPRLLGPRATFGDLVRAARSLSGTRELAGSAAGCLVGRDAAGYVLAADLMPSLERMPDPPSELGARFERRAEPFAVLTAWGLSGSPSATTLLAAFTATAPAALTRDPTLLVLDGERAFVLAARDRSDLSAAGWPVAEALPRAAQLTPAGGVLYVTATASVPLERLASALAQLDAASPPVSVALAVLLPASTAPPAASAPPAIEACPAGLPEVDDATPLGDLTREQVMPALADLHRDVAPCLTTLRVPETRVALALRVGESGGVERACFIDPGALDPRTASCVLVTASALRLPAPSPRGVVDLRLPIALASEAPAVQRALCPR